MRVARRRPGGRRHEGLPARRRARHPAAPADRHDARSAWSTIGGRPLLDIWLDALGRGRRRRGARQHPPPRRPGRGPRRRRRAGAAGRAPQPRARAARQRRHAARQPRLRRGRGHVPRLSTPTTSPTSTCASLVDAHRAGGAVGDADGVPRRPARPSAASSRSTRRPGGRLRGEARRPRERPRQRRAVRLRPASVLDEIREPLPRDIGFDLLPRLVGRARAVAIGDSLLPRHRDARRRSSRAASALAGRSAPHDHHPDAAAGRPGRRRHRPARLLPRARRPGAERRDRQVRLRRRQAALRRRHLRQLLRRRRSSRRVEDLQHELVREAMHMAGVRRRRRDHHAGRHPVRRARASARRPR